MLYVKPYNNSLPALTITSRKLKIFLFGQEELTWQFSLDMKICRRVSQLPGFPQPSEHEGQRLWGSIKQELMLFHCATDWECVPEVCLLIVFRPCKSTIILPLQSKNTQEYSTHTCTGAHMWASSSILTVKMILRKIKIHQHISYCVWFLKPRSEKFHGKSIIIILPWVCPSCELIPILPSPQQLASTHSSAHTYSWLVRHEHGRRLQIIV